MAFQPSDDSFGIRRLGFKCSWWHPSQANDVVASEPSIFSENHDYKSFFRVVVNTYVPIPHTHIHTHTYTHTHTHGITTVTLAACMCTEGQ